MIYFPKGTVDRTSIARKLLRSLSGCRQQLNDSMRTHCGHNHTNRHCDSSVDDEIL